jgi:type IV pilus assembly protein PilA
MMKKAQQGFTLIELMIVVAIVGILAALALPAYQDYTVRAKVSELAARGDEAKTSVAEFYSTKGYVPATAGSAGFNTARAGYTRSVTCGTTDCLTINVVGGTLGGSWSVGNDGITLSGITAGYNGQVVWKCKPLASTKTKYLPASCR